eukprot:256415_1
MNNLHGTVYEGTFGIVLQSFFGIIGNLLVPVWFEKCAIQKISTISYIICITLICLITMMMLNVLFPFLMFYWFNNITIGFALGILSMSAETIVLLIQPTVYSGKISGAKGLFRNWLQGITAVCIAIWWEFQYNSLWYIIIISFSVGVV